MLRSLDSTQEHIHTLVSRGPQVPKSHLRDCLARALVSRICLEIVQGRKRGQGLRSIYLQTVSLPQPCQALCTPKPCHNALFQEPFLALPAKLPPPDSDIS